MGGFYIVRAVPGEPRERLVKRVETSFAEQGFQSPRRFRGANWTAGVFADFHGRASAVHAEDGEFCAVATGTLCHRGQFGGSALRSLYGEFDGRLPRPEDLSGAFAVLLLKGGRLHLFGDPLGLYRLYATDDARVITSSFLAVAAALDRPRPSAQGVYEYVFQEATFGSDTVLENVHAVPAYCLFEVTQDGIELRDRYALPKATIDRRPVIEHAEGLRDRIRDIFSGIGEAYANNVSTALSGGFDSRLALAALLDRGVSPEIHVYGRSADTDVRVAKAIAAGEGLNLEHVDKSQWTVDSPEQYAEQVRHNYLRFDGLPSDGILDSGGDFATRMHRGEAGQLHLNGGGGEVMRNFFYLPDRPLSVRQFLWSFYSRYDTGSCTTRFDEEAYLAAMGRKVRETLGLTGDALERAQIELLYPFFRCRFWTGRNNSINSRFGRELTPFLDYGLVSLATRVPLEFKNHGRIEALLIGMFSPRLARYQSAYGYSFDRDPPLSFRIKAAATYWRPPSLRRRSFKLQNRLAAIRHRAADSVRFLSAIVDPALPLVSHWFRPAQVGDMAQFRRLVTLEYFLRTSGATP